MEDRILGLDRGGDDYLAKPFALGELEARLRALSRRRSDAPAQKRLGRLCFDSIRNEVQVEGQRVELTARELSLVEALMQHPGRTVTKQRLFDALYSWDHEANLSVIDLVLTATQSLSLTLRLYATCNFYITVGDFGGVQKSTASDQES